LSRYRKPGNEIFFLTASPPLRHIPIDIKAKAYTKAKEDTKHDTGDEGDHERLTASFVLVELRSHSSIRIVDMRHSQSLQPDGECRLSCDGEGQGVNK
jgi:hypothetical protein